MPRILIAEDEESVSIFVSRALEGAGYETVAVADGGAALEALHLASYDLLLADIRMPVMDGITLALNAGSKFPGLPVLLMTGYSDERQRAHNLDKLIAGVLPKPFTLEQIVAAVQELVGPAEG